jgi:type II secretory pathway component GspD/PulD (secretin)
MIKRTWCVLAIALFMGILPSALPRIWAQEAGEQDTASKSTPQKNAGVKETKDTLELNDTGLAPDKRREMARVIKVFYLPAIATPTDLQDVVNALRTILEIQRIQQIPSSNSIIVRGTAEQVELAEKIIDDLTQDRKKAGGEYRLEFKINELNDDRKVDSRNYNLVADTRQVSRLHIGSQVLVRGADKDKDKDKYLDLGKNIDCHVRTENEHAIGLRLTVEVSGVAEHGAAETEKSDPVIQRSRIETSSILELGKPLTVGSFYDPSSKHNVQIEVTATRTR